MFYLIYQTGYDDPVPLVGPYLTYAEALARYRANLIESGCDIEDEMPSEELYATDDAVLIGRVI